MEKLRMTSPDLTASNVAKIAELFPGVITETIDAEGNPVRAVDFDLLRQELSEHLAEGPQERYQLDWPGKRAAAFAANAPIAKTLRPLRDESVDFDSTKNLFIEGDNLDALKLLQESYLGKVKLIYIDPPYNTGNDFIYKDDFATTTEEYLRRSGQTGEDGVRLVANTESNGRFHSDWLSMIYPRLKLARNLLRTDGTIAVSIDDGELSNLVAAMSEIFGADNHIATVIWEKVHTRKNSARRFSVSHDYIVMFARSIEHWDRQLFPRETTEAYRNADDDPKGPWKLDPIYANNPYDADYTITKPNGTVLRRPPGQYWRFSESSWAQKVAEGAVVWGRGDGYPMAKRYLSEVQDGLVPVTLWDKEFAGDNRHGKEEVERLIGAGHFPYPKPTRLLKRLMQVTVRPNDLVLDFFAGSGSTADAVMQLNLEDGGSRRFIMVQLNEQSAPRSEAGGAGYATIADLSRERIRRAAAKVIDEAGPAGGALDCGFRTLRVDSTNLADVLRTPDETDQQSLVGLEDSVKAGRTGEDLLFQVLLDWGLEVGVPIAVEQIEGHEVFVVEDGALVACFDGEVSLNLVSALAKREPLRAVFRDSSFMSDDARINAEQIFKELSPATEIKAI
ncbi:MULTISPECIES: site-specific DNA-methyltransferase [unclassified Modestobacter]